ncbi:MAG: hypothetical protein JWM11_3032, partial [Planctomycetaceae bacterium]|nr:hypothetical protein [Planctomycetaceae bacterium]
PRKIEPRKIEPRKIEPRKIEPRKIEPGKGRPEIHVNSEESAAMPDAANGRLGIAGRSTADLQRAG